MLEKHFSSETADSNTTQLLQGCEISAHRSAQQAPVACCGCRTSAELCEKHAANLLNTEKYSVNALCITFWGRQGFHRAVRTSLALWYPLIEMLRYFCFFVTSVFLGPLHHKGNTCLVWFCTITTLHLMLKLKINLIFPGLLALSSTNHEAIKHTQTWALVELLAYSVTQVCTKAFSWSKTSET